VRFGSGISWGADTEISMPAALPAQRQVYVDFGGFCFTKFGIGHPLREADLEEYRQPIFAPPPPDEGS
jgi:hypothetical protein